MSTGRAEIREIEETLGRRAAQRRAEPKAVQEIAQPLPTGVDGHDTAAAATAAAQQNVDLEHSPQQVPELLAGVRAQGDVGVEREPLPAGAGLAASPLARRCPPTLGRSSPGNERLRERKSGTGSATRA